MIKHWIICENLCYVKHLKTVHCKQHTLETSYSMLKNSYKAYLKQNKIIAKIG